MGVKFILSHGSFYLLHTSYTGADLIYVAAMPATHRALFHPPFPHLLFPAFSGKILYYHFEGGDPNGLESVPCD